MFWNQIMTSFSIQFQYILEVKIYKKSWNFRGGSGSDFESPRAPSDAEENTIVFEELPFRPRAPPSSIFNAKNGA